MQYLELKNPAKVIQVFRNSYTYDKTEKSFADRKEKLAWRPISSTCGYVHNGIVHLPKTIVLRPDFPQSETIILLDDNRSQPTEITATPIHTQYFKSQQHIQLDIFNININDVMELHLKYGVFEVGLPKRADFKLGELKIDRPLGVKINGKLDFSLTGRRERKFRDQEYIFEYLGDFRQVGLLAEPFPPIEKKVPEVEKLIDLTKPLF